MLYVMVLSFHYKLQNPVFFLTLLLLKIKKSKIKKEIQTWAPFFQKQQVIDPSDLSLPLHNTFFLSFSTLQHESVVSLPFDFNALFLFIFIIIVIFYNLVLLFSFVVVNIVSFLEAIKSS